MVFNWFDLKLLKGDNSFVTAHVFFPFLIDIFCCYPVKKTPKPITLHDTEPRNTNLDSFILKKFCLTNSRKGRPSSAVCPWSRSGKGAQTMVRPSSSHFLFSIETRGPYGGEHNGLGCGRVEGRSRGADTWPVVSGLALSQVCGAARVFQPAAASLRLGLRQKTPRRRRERDEPEHEGQASRRYVQISR